MTPTLEDICRRFFKDERWPLKSLIGGALLISLIGWPWVFGYLFRYWRRVVRHGKYDLVEWRDWRNLLAEGLIAGTVFLVFFVLPLMLVRLLAVLVTVASFGVLALVGWGIMSFSLIVVPALFASAIFELLKGASLVDLLRASDVFKRLVRHWKSLLLPGLALTGSLVVCAPLLPFAIFAGLALYVAYALTIFALDE